MGNICTSNQEKFETTQTVDYKNTLKISVTLGKSCSIDLISGNFRQHKSESILVITEMTSIDHCQPLREYVSEPQKTIQLITSQRKLFYKAPSVNKTCPYKKLFLAILPKYLTEQAQQYQQHFRNIIKQLLSNSKDITIEFLNTIDGITQIPNQMILAILFKELQEVKSNIRLSLISNEKKMMNLYKFQLLKTQACKMRFFEQSAKDHF